MSEISIEKAKEEKVLVCDNCTVNYGANEAISWCKDCVDPFEEGDEFYCIDAEHYCQLCGREKVKEKQLQGSGKE